MIVAKYKIKKIIREEIERALYENQSDSDLILDLGIRSAGIVNSLGYVVMETGESDSRYLQFFQDVLEEASRVAEENREDEDGKYRSLVAATNFYSENINKFPSSLRSEVLDLLEKFNQIGNNQLFSSAEDIEIEDSKALV